MAGSGGRDDDEPHEQQLDANSRPVDGGVFGWQRSESAEDAASRPPREDRSDIRIALVGAAQ
ncbi:hypothetical protein [Halorubrum lacusprofundi]|jgi:hypothetical protein|uniref:hypothetical protein n=1 Tax=Halorubrum lacusprofundi TaxID=2247 RepID=UPI0006781CC5|nr:hypothetical protein [Halorubrum lacusprofundi]MCG1005850.1 hypothetical protein [Halorubrum lacusprofundi]